MKEALLQRGRGERQRVKPEFKAAGPPGRHPYAATCGVVTLISGGWGREFAPSFGPNVKRAIEIAAGAIQQLISLL